MQENPVESHKGAWWKPTFCYLGRYFCVLWNSTKIALKITKCISIVCCKHKLSTTVIIKVMRLSMKATIFPNELYYRTIVFLLLTRCFHCISHRGNCKTSTKIPPKIAFGDMSLPEQSLPRTLEIRTTRADGQRTSYCNTSALTGLGLTAVENIECQLINP